MTTSVSRRSLTVLVALGVLITGWTQSAFADSAILKANPMAAFGPSIPVDSPTFCWGLNNLDQCVLYYGSANSCSNTTPCNNTSYGTKEIKSAVADVAIGRGDLTFCYGADDVTGQCKLFLGTREQCDHVEPCSVGFKKLDPKLTTGR